MGALDLRDVGLENAGFCFYDGFNDFHKMIFSYLIPFTMILTLVFIIIFAENCSCTLPCEQVNTFRAILFVLVIPYQAIIRITLDILKRVEINGESRVANFAVLRYMEGEHLYYAIPAIFILNFVVVLPFSLVIPNLFCTRYRWYLSFFTPLLEGFLSVFKNNLVCHLFCGFYFLFHLILLLMSTFLERDQLQLTLMASFCFMMFLLFAKVRPYRNDIYNKFDMGILFNLTVIGFLSNGKLTLSMWDSFDVIVNQTIMVLLWVPLVIWLIALFMLYWLT